MVALPINQLRRIAMLTLASLGLGPVAVYAQNSGTSSMNVTVRDVLQLTVNTPSVGLLFETPDNFKNGVSSTVNNQLTVTCNRPYDLSIKTAGDLSDGTRTIPVSNVSAQTVGGGVGTASTVSALSTTDQALATGIPASMSKNITLQYATAANNAAFLVPAATYTTTLTFTATPN